jgi:hypothetical protein
MREDVEFLERMEVSIKVLVTILKRLHLKQGLQVAEELLEDIKSNKNEQRTF